MELRRGATGPAVGRVQRQLNTFAAVTPKLRDDNAFGDETERGVRQLQAFMFMEETGVADHGTLLVLGLPDLIWAGAPSGGGGPAPAPTPNVSADFVPAGSRVRWAAQGLFGGLTTYDTQVAALRDAIARSGFSGVTAGGHRIFNLGAYKFALIIEGTTARQYGHINDVRDELTGLAQSLGWSILPAQNSIVFVSRPAIGGAPSINNPSGASPLGSGFNVGEVLNHPLLWLTVIGFIVAKVLGDD
jgi:peptidoglycan hydrolase-like protein with peptidoglycan-binding domain